MRAESMLEFAQHLRDHPDDDTAPERLSAQFGIPVAVVQEALQARSARRSPSRDTVRRSAPRKLSLNRIGALVFTRPVLSLALLSLLLSYPAFLGLSGNTFGALYIGHAVVLTLTAAISSYFKGQLWYGIVSPYVVSVVHMGCLQYATLYYANRFTWNDLTKTFAFILSGSLVIGTVLASFTIGAAMLGSLARIRRETAEELRLDRLKLLERVMQIQDRLESASEPVKIRLSVRDRLEWARGNWFLIAIGGGLVGFATSGTIMSTVGFPDPTGRTPPSLLSLAVATLSLVFEFALNLFIGFVSGSFLKGVLSSLTMAAISNCVWLLPTAYGGIDKMVIQWTSTPLVWCYLLITIVTCGIAGMAASVEERSYRQARIAGADQAALLAEMVRLQQILSRGAAEVCVLAVDTVGSTRMKQGEDALRVELSFRSFQDLVERVTRAHSGRVFSTAGDGALAEFSTVEEAFLAATDLLRRLPDFNVKVNRLRSPFQVRIGIHFGEVHGELEKAEFTQVIDVAAHMESVAPAGGIALTGTAAQKLPKTQLAPLAQKVDGHEVFVWAAPVPMTASAI